MGAHASGVTDVAVSTATCPQPAWLAPSAAALPTEEDMAS